MSRAVMTTITNICMIYDGNKVVIQDRIDKNGVELPFRVAMWKKMNPSQMQ